MKLMRWLVAVSLALGATLIGFAAAAGLSGSLTAAALVAALFAGGVGWAAGSHPPVPLDPAASSRGLAAVSGAATLVALVQVTRLLTFVVDPSHVGASCIPSSN